MIRQITITQGDSVRLWDLEIDCPDTATAKYVISSGPGQRALVSGEIDLSQETRAVELNSAQTIKLLPGRYLVGVVVESRQSGSRKEVQGSILVKPSVVYDFTTQPPSGAIEDINVAMADAKKGVF